MNKRSYIAAAAIGGLLAAGACMKKEAAVPDSTAVITDTAAGAVAPATGTSGTPSATMSDTAASGSLGSGMQDTAKGRSSGDTTTKK
jgi:hypothetical protein